jgi:hypothetical protein
LFDPGSLVARQIVRDDNVALRELGHEAFLDPFLEQGGVDRPVESLLRHEAGKARTGDEWDCLVDECDCLAMVTRNGDAQPSPSPTASASARKIGGRPRLVDEQRFPRIEVELRGKPALSLLQDVRALLLLGMRGLYSRVTSWPSKKAPDHGGSEALAAIGDQAFLDLEQRHVRLAANETEQIVAMGPRCGRSDDPRPSKPEKSRPRPTFGSGKWRLIF